MKKDMKFYWTLFISTFTISAFTFGGGYVIVPLMRKKFVQELKWIEDDEMLDLITIAQSSPGAMAVNTSIILGYKLAGVLGSLITILGTVLPPLIIITIISYFYEAFRSNKYVSLAMLGMQAGVAAVLVDVVISMVGSIVKNKKIVPIIVLVCAFIATYFFKVNILITILICAFIGYLSTKRNDKSEVKK